MFSLINRLPEIFKSSNNEEKNYILKNYWYFCIKARRASLAGAVGIEPTPTVLETVVLPLNHAPNNTSKSRKSEVVKPTITYCLIAIFIY